MLDNYPDNEILGTVIDSIQGELEKKAEKSEIPEVPVQDVQVNGTSVLHDGVANVPIISSTLGVAKANPAFGIYPDGSGSLKIVGQNANRAKIGTDTFHPVISSTQHLAAFYGLAKAAGADEKDSTLPVGQYTDTAKSAIKNMLGITQTLTVTVLTQDNITVTGQTVTIRAVDAIGPIFATAAYEGQSVSFAVPSGFAYYISVSDTLDYHFNPTTASGIITNTDVAVTL